MRRRPLRAALIVIALALGMAACEPEPEPTILNTREAKPPPGTGATAEFCMVVRNRAPFSITGRVVLKTRERQGFRLSRNQSTRLCLKGTLYGNNTVSFVLTNFVTMPTPPSYTQVHQAVHVMATRQGDGWIYSATCWR